jgi:hypothetical protein
MIFGRTFPTHFNILKIYKQKRMCAVVDFTEELEVEYSNWSFFSFLEKKNTVDRF